MLKVATYAKSYNDTAACCLLDACWDHTHPDDSHILQNPEDPETLTVNHLLLSFSCDIGALLIRLGFGDLLQYYDNGTTQECSYSCSDRNT